jgi:hypothetical protein
MKTKLLITSLCLVGASVYAQPGPGIRNEVGLPPPTVRAEMPRESASSMPQPGIQRPEPQFIGGPQPAVGATGGNGGNGGNGGLFVGNGGNGGSGASQSEAQAKVRLEEAQKNPSNVFANTFSQSEILRTAKSAALTTTVSPRVKVQNLEKATETQTAVGATGVSTPMTPLPESDAKGPPNVGVSQSQAQAKARLEEAHENSTRDLANANSQSQIIQEVESKALMPGGVKASK